MQASALSAKGSNFLFDEIRERIAKGPINFHVVVHLAEPGDTVDDATVRWPESRPQIRFGEVILKALVGDNDAEQRRIIFDPIPRVDGIEASADPLFEVRADLYLLSGPRRRGADLDPTSSRQAAP